MQLGIDESRKLSACALNCAERGDVGALAVLVLLYLGLRASELVNLLVRDLDDRGRMLWVRDHHGRASHLKTAAARRDLRVPTFLKPHLLKLAAKRPAHDLLFGQHWRDWPRKQTVRLCELAGVPIVTAHGLRGLKATLALRAGEDPDVLARSLGHTSKKMTFSAYAAPGSRDELERKLLEKTLRDTPKKRPPMH